MKPKFVVSFEGTIERFAVRYWRGGKDRIPHEAFPNVPFNTNYGGWLFSDDEIATAFQQTLNQKITNTVKKFQKLNKQENPK